MALWATSTARSICRRRRMGHFVQCDGYRTYDVIRILDASSLSITQTAHRRGFRHTTRMYISDPQQSNEQVFKSCISRLFDIFVQPLLPLLTRESARNTTLLDPVEQDCWGYMHPSPPIGLDHQLNIVGHLVSHVQTPIVCWRLRDLERVEKLLLVYSYFITQFRQPLIRRVPPLVHDIDIEVFILVLEERG